MQANVKIGARGAGGAPLTELELGAWRGMLAAHAALTRGLDADLRAEHGIALGTYEALMLLGTSPSGRLRVSELSRGALLSISGMSRMIDRLERDGLVRREACEEDGRGAEVALTDAGRAVLADARASHLRAVRERFLEHFDDAELATLAEAWRRVTPPDEG
ncbi:MAG TPA: MarR family transcriptional regulator [Miltoncostaea sp.]|jgi:DNA-binding MarR family transcriptional regulator|nr:MarR family transcriptional regulator [Miltoncostaea sp.]